MKITEILAVYGAVLSSLTFLWTVARARPSVKVDLLYGIEGTASGVCVIVRNKSAHPVRLIAISLLYERRKRTMRQRVWQALRYRDFSRYLGWVSWSPILAGLDTGCPVTIEPNDAYRFLVPLELAEKLIAKSSSNCIAASVQDALWNNYYSDRYS
ncbi:hypothetical protein [Stenotrophomonas maltophilia group sp. Smal32]|uniref:hypothetical protein n=1 Tax=Stenotrophomonas maltophilia group sp. Smal32 TaxID=3377164 RepID=UPI0025549E45|nr:hypothetical protein [Stenotrophomonas maltophilia]